MKTQLKTLINGLLLAGSMSVAMQGIAGTTTRVSVASDSTQGNNESKYASITADGRFIAFRSFANNLVVGDTNGRDDIFVHDRQTGETTLVSVASDGTQGNSTSTLNAYSMSTDGRFIAFRSFSDNLVTGDTNGEADIFVHDRQTGETTRISVASDGTQGNNTSSSPAISADGRFIAFKSDATDLVAGDTNSRGDIFVHDRLTGETSRVSVASDGTQGNNFTHYPSISANGRFVGFFSGSNNLVADDTNGKFDIFVHDRQTSKTTRVSVASDGTQGNNSSPFYSPPSFSADGRFVTFASAASNLVTEDTNGASDIFLHDRLTGETSRVSVASDGTQGNNFTHYPSISANGRFVGFFSGSNNLVADDTNGKFDIFVHDRQTSKTTRVSVASDGTQGNNSSPFYSPPSFSADGRFVTFASAASNLVTEDTNGASDIFLHDRQTGETSLVSVAINGINSENYKNIFYPFISADGRFVAYSSNAKNLVAGDTNLLSDVFVYALSDTTPPPTSTPAKLELTATINGNDTLPKPGPALSNSGSPANWQYNVTKSGDETASLVRLYGKQIEPVRDSKWTLLCALGDITGSNTASCSSSSLIADGAAKILLSAQGRDKNGDKVIIGTPAWYVGGADTSAPALSLEVLLNGVDDDNAAPGVDLTTGDSVTYTYNVTNIGPFALTNVRVFDRDRLPVKTDWKRACVFDTIVPAESVSCTRTITAGAGAIRRDVTVQSNYQSQRVKDDEASFYTGQ